MIGVNLKVYQFKDIDYQLLPCCYEWARFQFLKFSANSMKFKN